MSGCYCSAFGCTPQCPCICHKEDRLIKIVIRDRDEVLITREQADRLEANGDMATYRMSREQLMVIIDERW